MPPPMRTQTTKAINAIVIPDGPRFLAAGIPRSLGGGGTGWYGYGLVGIGGLAAVDAVLAAACATRGMGSGTPPCGMAPGLL